MAFWHEWGQALTGAAWLTAGAVWLAAKGWDRWMR